MHSVKYLCPVLIVNCVVLVPVVNEFLQHPGQVTTRQKRSPKHSHGNNPCRIFGPSKITLGLQATTQALLSNATHIVTWHGGVCAGSKIKPVLEKDIVIQQDELF